MQDILRESWVFQELIKEGLEQGLERGLEQGLEQAKRQDIIRFVELRFPILLSLAKEKAGQARSLEQLQTLLDKLYRANTVEEATVALQIHEMKQ